MEHRTAFFEMPNSALRWLVATGIATILLAILIGPAFSPPEFNWIQHSTSEQAGQHMPGAWIMRAGFVGYGLTTALAAIRGWRRAPWVRSALVVFGCGLLATAIWSNAPIVESMPADNYEDWLHSVASGVVGTGFAAACAAKIFAPKGKYRDPIAWWGLIIAIVIPLAMGWLPEWRGLLQRTMFAYSFVFVWREFWSEASNRL